MTFAENLKYQRKRAGYTQEALAKLLLVTPQAISKWETGAGTPDLTMLIPLAKIFGISTDELLGKVDLDPRDEIVERLYDIWNDPTIPYLQKYQTYQNMLRANPNSLDILCQLLLLINEWVRISYNSNISPLNEEQREALLTDAYVYADRIIALPHAGSRHTDALGLLAEVYISARRYNRAEEEIAKLPYGHFTQSRLRAQLAQARGDKNEALREYRQSIADALVWMFHDIEQISGIEALYGGDSLPYDRLMHDLVHALYGNSKCPIPLQDPMRLATANLARQACLEGDYETAFAYLDEFIAIVREMQIGLRMQTKTGCLLFPEAVKPHDQIPRKRIRPRRETQTILRWREFDCIRQDPRFKYYTAEVNTWQKIL